ncbi:type II secretion system protein [Pseudomonas citronellolis]|uniref:type II secretion system protein n=1 Tax=Pseudomonas citronellolis TaxID=53408 RepID=UPI0023E46E75|nr:type II secretion system protein [Pseudomonas citronellolis]MDF3935224.1 type II secretion system protein [Pseudomonas citronellolis]
MAASMRNGERGFSFLGVLFVITLMGALLATTGQLWATGAQRERERQLLWVGNQYAKALRGYYRASPGLAQYPQRLEDLLEDQRFPTPARHLRKLYADPLGGGDWGLVLTIDGRIAGVYSKAPGEPLLRANFPDAWREFEGMGSYADWRFVAEKAFQGNDAGVPSTGGSDEP